MMTGIELLSIKEQLIAADRWLFLLINNKLSNPFFDVFLPFMRQSLHWAPLYIFTIFFMILNFKKKGAWWIVFFIITVSVTDMVGNNLLKETIQRLRPCREPDFSSQVRLLLGHCSSSYSFVSNHAANHFAMATFFYATTRLWLGRWAALGFVWAAVISFAQIYVGIHYPSDILGGALLGFVFGLTTSRLFTKRFGSLIFDDQPTLTT